jgi:uncharacterized protein YjbI with pentapeptide repeats
MNNQRVFALLVVLSAGCGARFVSFVPEDADLGGADPGDLAVTPPDLAGVDLSGADLTGPAETVLAGGSFSGRASYSASGDAELVRAADGSFSLRFLANFTISTVPGPIVLLTQRDAIGASGFDAAQGDLRLGALTASRGAQSYALPGDPGARRWAWVYCEPFRVEIARAQLVDR